MDTEQTLKLLLYQCASKCHDCIQGCLSDEAIREMRECITISSLCANLCLTTARFVSTPNAFQKEMVELCRQVCNACKETCEKHPQEYCQYCADACRECEGVCSKYLHHQS